MVNKNNQNTNIIWPSDELNNLNNMSNLVILAHLKKRGFPDNTEDRAKVLHALRLRKENNYPVTYEGLAEFLPEFADLYPQDEIIKNATDVITGKDDYFKEVLSSFLSNEQKEILLLSIPF